jgi:hypothetical protein
MLTLAIYNPYIDIPPRCTRNKQTPFVYHSALCPGIFVITLFLQNEPI